jgi:hypothetical protein
MHTFTVHITGSCCRGCSVGHSQNSGLQLLLLIKQPLYFFSCKNASMLLSVSIVIIFFSELCRWAFQQLPCFVYDAI